MINNRKSPIQDDYLEKHLIDDVAGVRKLNLTATLDAEAAYKEADFVVIAAPTNYDSNTQQVDTSAVETATKLVMPVSYTHLDVYKRQNRAKAAGHRVVCVGTTSCRTVESACDENGLLQECCDNTEIFIYPGYRFKVLDALITNFHLPESTLVMLVSALAGREHVLAAYKEAVKEKYRFFSST